MVCKFPVLLLTWALFSVPLSAQKEPPSKLSPASDAALQQTSTPLGVALQIPRNVSEIKGFANPVNGSKFYALELAPGEAIRATLAHTHGGIFISWKTLLTSPDTRLGRSKNWTEYKNTTSTSVQLFLTVKDEEHWSSQEHPYTLSLQWHPPTQ